MNRHEELEKSQTADSVARRLVSFDGKLRNFGWLSFGSLFSTMVALPISILVARHLGPTDFGKLSYASAIVSLFAPLTCSGLSRIVVRDLTRKEGDAGTTLGSSLFIHVIGGVLAASLAPLLVFWLRPGDTIMVLVVTIASIRNVSAAANVVDYAFQASLQNKLPVVARIVASLFTISVKLVLLWYQASFLSFAAATAVESLVFAALLGWVYSRFGEISIRWQVQRERMKTLLRESWPLTVAGFAIIAQSYVDQVMLGEMLDDATVGQYSVAIRLISVVSFAAMGLQKTLAPSITLAKGEGRDSYRNSLSHLYQLMFGLFLLQGIPTFFLADTIVYYCYGHGFAEAGSLLSLLAIRLLFANYGIARSAFIANESLFAHSLVTALAGFLVNVICNWILIPIYGAQGAIVSTVLSFFVTVFLLDAFPVSTRENFELMVWSPVAALKSAFRLTLGRLV